MLLCALGALLWSSAGCAPEAGCLTESGERCLPASPCQGLAWTCADQALTLEVLEGAEGRPAGLNALGTTGDVLLGNAEVSVVIDAYPDPPVVGSLSRVADLAVKRERGSKVKHLKVIVALDETLDFMKPGMTTRAEVLIESVPDVISVPLEAIFGEADERYVYERGLSGWSRQSVTLGQANDTHVIISEGLDDGDEVALIDPESREAGVADGS